MLFTALKRQGNFDDFVLQIIPPRAFNSYLKAHRSLYYYKYSGGYEIDLLIENQKKTLSSKQLLTAIEIKSTKNWDRRWNEPLFDLREKSKRKVKKLVGIYRGNQHLQFGDLDVYPVEEFLIRLSKGEFF